MVRQVFALFDEYQSKENASQSILPDGSLFPTIVGMANGQSTSATSAQGTSRSSLQSGSTTHMQGTSTARGRTVGSPPVKDHARLRQRPAAVLDKRAPTVRRAPMQTTLGTGAIMKAMPTEERDRRKFFQRPDAPRSMRVTPRDIALLQNIGRFRLASTTQLALLDGGSSQNVSRALLALWENGFVERPEAQVASRMLYEGSRLSIGIGMGL